MDKRNASANEKIKSVFLDLIGKYNIKEITVTEICQRSEINRSTFYKYFENVYDLLEKLEADIVNDVRQKLCEDFNMQKLFLKLEDIEQNDLQNLASIYKEDPLFARNLGNIGYEAVLSYIETNYEKFSKIQTEYVSKFIAAGCSSMIRNWLISGGSISSKEMIDLIPELMRRILL